MREEVEELSVANTTRRRHSSSFAWKWRSRIFAQQELHSGWVMFLVDRRAYTCRSSDALAHLHVSSTKRADYFAYSSPSLACKCESEGFRPIRGVRLPHGASFERERDQTCCYCSMFVPWDVCSTRHPDFRFGLPHAEVCPLHVAFS